MATQASALKTETGERDAVMKAMQSYIDGVKLGDSKIMCSGFHEGATIFGHYPGGVMANPIQALFEWIDKNGPSPNLQTEFTKIEVVESIAAVQLEVRDLSGVVAGPSVRMSDIFTLLRTDERLEDHAQGFSLAQRLKRVWPFAAEPVEISDVQEMPARSSSSTTI
jgi:hypothetical protein